MAWQMGNRGSIETSTCIDVDSVDDFVRSFPIAVRM